MNVNRIKINIKDLDYTESNINIPLGINFQNVDQSDDINRDFVNDKVNENINPILDYDKTKFTPKKYNTPQIDIIDNVKYRVLFLNNSGSFTTNILGDIVDSKYSEQTFITEDIKFRKNKFTKTFLSLNFYDSDINTNQRLISIITLYPKIDNSFYDIQGNLLPSNQISIVYNLKDSKFNKLNNTEGFFIYNYKDDVENGLPYYLYMRARFNNAKTGKSTNLVSNKIPNKPIDELIKSTNGTNLKNNTYTRYILKRENNKYYYEIDLDYSENVKMVGDSYIVDLHEISVL